MEKNANLAIAIFQFVCYNPCIHSERAFADFGKGKYPRK